MKIGVLVAMDKEAALVEEATRGRDDVALRRSGIGKVNAALAAQRLIMECAPDAIVSTGVAGGTCAARADVLDVVVGERCAYHDVNCGPDVAEGQVQGLPREFHASPPLLAAALGVASRTGKARPGLIATGDQFVTSPDQVRRILEIHPGAAAVDMESAAIAQACFLHGVPFISLRVISDVPGSANRYAQYNDFWERVGAESFKFLRQFLEAIVR